MPEKNAIVFLRKLPPPYYEMARKYFNMTTFYVKANSLSQVLICLMNWNTTEEGYDFWQAIYANALYLDDQKQLRKNARNSKG